MKNEIAEKRTFDLVPSDFDEAWRFSQLIAKSGMVPKDYANKPEAVMVAVQWGLEIGLKPLQALQNIAVINGRPCVWGDAALAIVTGHADFEDIAETVSGDGEKMIATCTVKRKGRSDVVRTFSAADAKRAGLWGKSGPWTNYTSRMMQMRARGFATRDAFPDALKGIGLAEEQMDAIEIEINERPAVKMPKAKKQAQETQNEPEYVDTSTGEIVQPEQESVSEQVEPEQEEQSDAVAEAAAFFNESQDPEPVASEGAIRMIIKKCGDHGVQESDVCKKFSIQRLAQLPQASVNDALAFIKSAQA